MAGVDNCWTIIYMNRKGQVHKGYTDQEELQVWVRTEMIGRNWQVKQHDIITDKNSQRMNLRKKVRAEDGGDFAFSFLNSKGARDVGDLQYGTTSGLKAAYARVKDVLAKAELASGIDKAEADYLTAAADQLEAEVDASGARASLEMYNDRTHQDNVNIAEAKEMKTAEALKEAEAAFNASKQARLKARDKALGPWTISQNEINEFLASDRNWEL